MTQLRIIGAGGHGKVVAETAEACGYSDIAFLDISWPERHSNGCWPIVGVPQQMKTKLFCAIGRNNLRAQFFNDLNLNDSPILLHPTAVISPTANLGAGTLAVAGSIVNADAEVGRGVNLNTGCSVDHDCRVGDFAHISPGARLAGGVSVGEQTWIGIGAVVREGIKIGNNVLVAAGAAVVSDIEDGAQVGGVPARKV
ncbi:MAG: acetyltransferase [Rhizobiaceae bacterium]|nr:acetyltransferase [Rhizobiaceae bacterium]